MPRALLAILALLLLATPPATAEDTRTSFLEQEVRNLQRQVLLLTRQVDELRNTPSRDPPRTVEARDAAPATEMPSWVNAGKWRALRPGMSELEVIDVLGRPTSMREEGGVRTLFYAMEIGASGFLGGSVRMRDRKVIEALKPALQ